MEPTYGAVHATYSGFEYRFGFGGILDSVTTSVVAENRVASCVAILQPERPELAAVVEAWD
jgi:hypothetical protein